ncbi:peptide chain release factor N(5)-glutamine methyltransferase [Chitinivibrio alkaliphilus]|uniref:peptide chain release factor N(5)-glutamine methyltransferase n=1 Tax=Chitinivibrio alkaliphilus ACht1 TaxID=1313304 RepID=U7D363_9BACT|nr:peptide chain release factor N(5)-glutamine methyltransferase [Chitinivibrio alkaliphilus]ERP30944.1 protein-(glutamine-N5) methyltransferase, release factor-specific [Chitinivibrio alkaliphilus ACht1]
MTLKEFYFYIQEKISAFSPTVQQDCDILFEHITTHRPHAVLRPTSPPLTDPIPEAYRERLDKICHEYARGVPLAYCMGECFFFNKAYRVSPHTLIPRQDTESLILTCLEKEGREPLRVLELGTGSGIICETLREERPTWEIYSVDISPEALLTAKENCNPAITLIASDSFSALRDHASFDILISNPPYIPAEEIPNLDTSVRAHEPLGALNGGTDGLYFYRYLAEKGKKLLYPQGRLYLEIGWDQGTDVPAILHQAQWNTISCHPDLAGRDRVVTATA